MIVSSEAVARCIQTHGILGSDDGLREDRGTESVIFPKGGNIMFMRVGRDVSDKTTKKDALLRPPSPLPFFPLRYESPRAHILCEAGFTPTSLDTGGPFSSFYFSTSPLLLLLTLNTPFTDSADGSQTFVAACGSSGRLFVKDIASDR